jgi:hypothetical protein
MIRRRGRDPECGDSDEEDGRADLQCACSEGNYGIANITGAPGSEKALAADRHRIAVDEKAGPKTRPAICHLDPPDTGPPDPLRSS